MCLFFPFFFFGFGGFGFFSFGNVNFGVAVSGWVDCGETRGKKTDILSAI